MTVHPSAVQLSIAHSYPRPTLALTLTLAYMLPICICRVWGRSLGCNSSRGAASASDGMPQPSLRIYVRACVELYLTTWLEFYRVGV